MKIEKLLEDRYDQEAEENRALYGDHIQQAKRINDKCEYVLKLYNTNFEELAFQESEHMYLSQLKSYVVKYDRTYGDSKIVKQFLNTFNDEFMNKLHDYVNHIEQ